MHTSTTSLPPGDTSTNPAQGALRRFIRERSRRALCLPAALLTLGLLLSLPFLHVQVFAAPGSYLPIHNLLETLSTGVSLMVFLLVMSLSPRHLNTRLVIAGCGFLGVALIDLGHMLSYPGMADFFSPNSNNKALLFWLAARYVLCFVLLGHLLPPRACSRGVLWLGLLLVLWLSLVVWWAGIREFAWLPRLHDPQFGLRSLKLVAEYIALAIYAVCALLLYLRARRRSDNHLKALALAGWTIALSELYFTFHTELTELANVLGHLYKLVAYYLFFRAIFIAGVHAPYRELERERSWLNSLVGSIPEPVWLKDPGGVYLSCNHAFKGLCGKDPEQIVGRTDHELFSQAAADQFRANDLRALGNQGVNINEEWVDTWSQGRRLFETSKVAVRLPDGSVLGVLGLAYDITEQRSIADNLQLLAGNLEQEVQERRQVEDRLLDSNARYHALISNIPVPLLALTPDGTVSTWNQAAQQVFGFSEGDVLGRSARELFAAESQTIFERALQRPESLQQTQGTEVVCLGRQGNRIPGLLSLSPIRATDGALQTLIMWIEDVSERRSMEAQLRQAQKMEAVGQLTAGIAHDFNNILSVILGNLELLMDELRDTRRHQMARNAFNAGLRGASMTQRLLAYSCKQSLEPSIVDAGQLVLNEARLLERSLEESINLSLSIEQRLWKIRIDPSRLQDAILNLALNARDAMPEGGRLELAVANAQLDAQSLPCQRGLAPGRYVRIAVSDTGCGIPPELLEQVLEPFFTTKPVGAGSGLGLSMVYGFVRQTGGHFAISSTPGSGTCVTMHFPVVPDALLPGEADDGSVDCPRAQTGETVLLVEDDADVRRVVRTYLDALGYRCIETGDGPSALRLLEGGAQADLLLTDVVLPNGMRGPDIATAAQGWQPRMKALYMSGYARNALSENGELRQGVQLLHKPFAKWQLAQKLRELLDAR